MKRRTLRQLERAARHGGDGTDVAAAGSAAMTPFEAFWQRLAPHVPANLLATVRASFEGSDELSIRIDDPHADVSAIVAEMTRQGWQPRPLMGGETCWAYRLDVAAARRREVTDSPLVREGRIYVMNPSSMLPALALAPERDDAVLDLCAAPGGKTLHLSTLMGRQGRLTAVETVRERFFKLQGQLARHGASHVRTYLKDGRVVGRLTPERFDRILVDAPCSSEARIRVDVPESIASWSPRKVQECRHKQLDLMRSAVAALRPGGRLVYCTCSFSFEENEGVVGTILEELGEQVALVDTGLDAIPWVEPPALAPGLSHADQRLSMTRRVWPNRIWDGFFIAAFVKTCRDRAIP
jgi:16S rRNA C967 or C1407 C5-methylase (RsmB/RsmF family)